MTFKCQIIFFLLTNISKNKKKNISSHRGSYSGFLSFFTEWFEFFQKIDFKLLFWVFLHHSKSSKSNVLVPLHFGFTSLIHIFYSHKVLDKIQNRNLQHNFLEICDFLVNLEKISNICANLVKNQPKKHIL